MMSHLGSISFALIFLFIPKYILAKSTIDIKSKEEIVIYDKNEILFSDVGKIKEFRSVLVQLNQTNNELSKSDLYLFSDENKISMTLDLCEKYITKIFGAPEISGLQWKNTQSLFDTSTGKACDFQAKDSAVKSKIPVRYGIIGFIHGKLIASVWQLNSLGAENQTLLQKFWKTLR